MKILIIGNGGREHAIGIKIKKDNAAHQLFFAKGNGGTESIGTNISVSSLQEMVDFATDQKIDLTIVGSEALLMEGIVDEFENRSLKIFGPNKAAALLEGDKAFAKKFMNEFGVRTAAHKAFTHVDEAVDYVKNHSYPLVIKATGLAAGKGVFIVPSFENAVTTIHDLLINKIMGSAGDKIVIEEFLEGFEVSVLSIFNKKKIFPFISAKDHKKIYENEKGPNTGGMGVVAPNPLYTAEIAKDFEEHIMNPTLKGLLERNLLFSGVIFFGLMVVNQKCYLLEYNMRLGDPETQAILPLLNSNFTEVIENALNGNNIKLNWKNQHACCVVAASKGYPDNPETGKKITGLNTVNTDYTIAGAVKKGDSLITSGGRVLNVIGLGDTLPTAREKAYQAINHISFDGMYFRKDIGEIN